MTQQVHQSPILDVAGIGFGPSNLALAIALADAAEKRACSFNMGFYERQLAFGWHRGLLIEDATMQISFLKDLATLRNPSSPYTFVSYLHAKNRLAEFINSKALYPLRTEFHDYLEWAAAHFSDSVTYGAEIKRIEPVVHDGVIDCVDMVARHADGTERTVARARAVVIGTGLRPSMPPGLSDSARVIHSSSLLPHVRALDTPVKRVMVIGAGQSAAETTDYLHGTLPDAEIYAVFSKYGYSISDDSPFANRIFDSAAVDEFHGASESVKKMLIAYHRNTNYSVVDLELAQRLHGKLYREQVSGRRRLHVMNMSRVRTVEESLGGVQVEVEFLADGQVQTIDADLVVCATGYHPSDPCEFLGALSAECKFDSAGRLVLDRGYRVMTSDSVTCQVFVHGSYAEHSHGLSAGLLSNAATRAGEIARQLITT